MEKLLRAQYETVPYGQAAKYCDCICVTPQMLSNKLCPSNEQHKLWTVEAVKLMNATGNYGILEAMAEMCGKRVVPIELPKLSIMAAVWSSSAEHADVVKAEADSLQDGVIDVHEAVQMRKELIEQMEADKAKLSALDNIIAIGKAVAV